MTLKKAEFLMAFLLLISLLVPNIINVKGNSSTRPRVFRLLAIEQMYDSCYMKSAQYLIKELLRYPNWNNSTDDYVSYIHLISMYDYSEIDDEVKPFWIGRLYSVNLHDEIVNFLGKASPGEIVILYYCGHSHVVSGPPPHSEFLGISPEDLKEWLNSTLLQAHLILILDTCYSGYWTNFSIRSTVLASCEKTEFSWGWCHSWSWFTYIGIIQGFSFAEDSNNDGWISAAEVFIYAKNATEKYSEEIGIIQHPCFFFGQADGDIPLIQKDTSKPFPCWDIAVTSIHVDALRVEPKTNLTIKIGLENQGTKCADFDVRVYANSSLILTKRMRLFPGQRVNATFIWSTTDYGIYFLNCTVSVSPGETDVNDNVYSEYQIIIIAFLADINLDGVVDVSDIFLAAMAFGSSPESPRWNSLADQDGDNYVGIKDIFLVAKNFGKHAE